MCKTRVIIVAILFLLFGSLSVNGAEQGRKYPESFKNLDELMQWINKEFDSHLEIPDYWQTPKETIETKSGDCEDFAILTCDYINNQGNMSNNIIAISFKDLHVGHAICAWREDDGTYSFTSNMDLYNTNDRDLRSLVQEYYPDWENIELYDIEGKKQGVIRKSK